MVRLLWNRLVWFLLVVTGYLTQCNHASSADGNQPILAEMNTGINFNCPVYLSDAQPSSVHRLKPGDIRVVAALGGSITAGIGIDTSYVDAETRGRVFSIGADDPLEKMTTIPSILKKYNADLYGYSYGSGLDTESGFNVAYRGAKSMNMVEQTSILIERLQSDPNVDMEQDWKLITLYIGLDDFCYACRNVDTYRDNNAYVSSIDVALKKLKKKLPRAYVNVIQMFDVSGLRQLDANDPHCKSQRSNTCPCIVTEVNADLVSTMSRRYQEKVELHIDGGKYDTDTFTVVIHKQQNIIPSIFYGNPDATLFADDCTHLSKKGHDRTAANLWNNMFTAIGGVTQNAETGLWLACPSKEAYLKTNRNVKADDEVNFEEGKEDLKSKKKDKLLDHPYYAAMLITTFVIMIASISGIIIYFAVKDNSKEEKLKFYEYYFYDNEDYY